MARRTRPEDDDDTIVRDDDEEEDEQEAEPAPVRYITRRPSAGEADDDGADQTIPDRVLRIALPAPWAHLRIYGWFDYPKEIADRMLPVEGETNDEASQRVMDTLREVIVQHDGWKDRDGRVLPQPTTRKFWEQIPNPLATAIIRQFFAMVKRNPTPRASKRKTSKR